MCKMSVQMVVVALVAALAITVQAVDLQVPPVNHNNLGDFTATMYQPNDQVSDLLKWGVAMGVIGAKSKKLAKAIRGPRECWKNSQCPELRPYCLIEPSVGTPAETCVQCRTDNDCPEYQRPCSNVTNTCKPLVVPLTSVVITYSGETVTVATFTDADKAQVCANLLALAGLTTQNAICTVVAVLPGSVIVVAEVRALGGSPEDFASINALTTTLNTASPATLDTLSTGISQSPTATVNSVEEGTSSIDTSLPAPVVPTAPLNVQASFPANGACTNAVLVTWNAPTLNGGASIGTYVIGCSSGTTSVAKTVSASTFSAQLGPLVPGETYVCRVGAINAAGASPNSEPSPSFVATYPATCIPGAPTNPTTDEVANEPLQRTVSWEAPTSVGGGPVTSYLITCTTDSSESGTRTLVVDAPALTGVIGTGSPAGTNDPLLEGSVYTCSVAAINEFGTGSAADAAPFGTELFVTSLGTKEWWSAGTAICSNFAESTCTGTTRQLRGLVTTFPNYDYIGQGTTGYTAEDDSIIAQYNIYFTNAYAGSTNGAVVVNATNSNNGISDLHYYNTTTDGTPQSIVPASFLLSSDFKASYRMYYGIGAFTPLQVRNPAFTHNVFNPTSGAKYGVIYSDQACIGSNVCDQQWTTPNIDSSSGFIIRKQTAPTGWVCLDGTLNNACNTVYHDLPTWAASVGGAGVFATESFVWGVGSNLGTFQRNGFVAYDWLSTTVINLGAKINFDIPA